MPFVAESDPSIAVDSRTGSRLAPYGAALAGAATVSYVGLVDPSTGGWFPSCPTRASTGVWCPMCGMTRAVHHLLHGDIVTALRFNLFVVPVLLAIAAMWLGRSRRVTGLTGGPPRAPAVVWACAGAVLVAYAVVRNLPGLDVLRGG